MKQNKPRGRKTNPSPSTKTCALEVKSIYQLVRTRNEKFLNIFRKISPDIVKPATYGRILSREIIKSLGLAAVDAYLQLN